MKSPEEIARLRSKMIEHLEAALALADETGDGTTGYLIESALDALRAMGAHMWPGNLDLPPAPNAEATFASGGRTIVAFVWAVLNASSPSSARQAGAPHTLPTCARHQPQAFRLRASTEVPLAS
jgi:hypothetical protein